MKIDIKKSKTLQKLCHMLEEYDNSEKIEILSQLLIKISILDEIKKEIFIDYMSDCYDVLEKNANALGLI